MDKLELNEMQLDKLEAKLNRAEGLLTGLVLKDLETLNDYNINPKLLSEAGLFYIGVATKIQELGNEVVDEVNFSNIVETLNLTDTYKGYGGYQTIKEMTSIVDVRNADSIVDEFTKWNLVKRYKEKGILDIDKHWDKIVQMTSGQMEDYMCALMSDIAIKTGIDGNIDVYDLTTDYDKAIEEWDKGVAIGYKLGFPILNYELCGLHKGCMSLLLAHSGNGKTSLAIPLAILPVLEQGEKVMILANEQDCDAWRQMILATVLFNKVKYKGMNRQKLLYGGFTEKDREAMNQAVEWIEQYKGNLKFVELNDYGIENIRRIIKKYSKMGFGVMVVDTLKPEDDASEKAWGQFSETAKELFLLAKQNNIAMLCTAQLATNSYGRKYLDTNAIGKSKAIAEVCGQILMFRTIQGDEKEKLKVWRLKKDKITNKLTSDKEEVVLDKDKDYICLFVAKNRYGRGNIQLVYERNMSFNSYSEIGFTEIEYDGWGR
jgi:replicative DNA helicase